ncbi:oxidoreductase [Novosphingobium sp. FSW06-99]|uniref:oxidoreductase n=1 Tax=Novosphingobium sp. FSW06-99 TaxID=1739113 RepID=UPI0009E6D98A|nr:oxidoreductase [Novosphingobium sp. FSW06-99]
MKRIGVGIVGNGMATRVFHAPYIRAVPALDLRAVVSRHADAAAPVPGVALVNDIAALLDDPAIELVVIATPSGTHAELARRALDSGRHVVVEKPFAQDLNEARALTGLAAARGRIAAVFHNRRWDSDFLAVRAAIASGLIGPVVHFESRFDRFRPAPRDRWRENGGPGSGVWVDLGPHLIDQALLLFGTPTAVTADLAALRPGGRADDWAHVTLHYPDRRVVLGASMCVAGGTPRFAVHGLAGSLIKHGLDPQEAQSVAGLTPDAPDWGRDPEPLHHWDAAGARHMIMAPRGCQPTFYAMMAQACLGQGAPPTTPDQILAVQTVLDTAIVSARLGRTLPIEPA